MKQQSSNTLPIVETDTFGGHEVYVRMDQDSIAPTQRLPHFTELKKHPYQTYDPALLAAIQDLTELFREFTLTLLQVIAP